MGRQFGVEQLIFVLNEVGYEGNIQVCMYGLI